MAKKKVAEEAILEENELKEDLDINEGTEITEEVGTLKDDDLVECKVLTRLVVPFNVKNTGFLEVGEIEAIPYGLAVSLSERGLVDLDV